MHNSRAKKALRAAGITTIRQLVGRSEMELYMLPNMGCKSTSAIEKNLAELGLSLRPAKGQTMEEANPRDKRDKCPQMSPHVPTKTRGCKEDWRRKEEALNIGLYIRL